MQSKPFSARTDPSGQEHVNPGTSLVQMSEQPPFSDKHSSISRKIVYKAVIFGTFKILFFLI